MPTRSLLALRVPSFTRLLRAGVTWTPWIALAISAYWSARGATALIGTELLTEPASVPKWHSTRARIAPVSTISTSAARSARPILERNPFDSATGPLGEAAPTGTEPPTAMPPIDPLAAPRCEGLHVFSTIESGDPTWSTAVIQAPGEQRGLVRRIGDRIGERSLVYIGFNIAEESPAVWLSDGAGICQCVLFGSSPRVPAGAKPHPAPPPPQPQQPKTNAAAAAAALPPELASKITRVSDSEFQLERSAVDPIIGRSSELMRGTRFIPVQQGGRVVGFQLRAVRADGLLAKLGLREGDRIEAINGLPLSSPEQALQAYARLRTAPAFDVRFLRGSRPMTINYRIR